ncbi:MAG: peptidoglycan DD-metalloendopeptidase family protein [Chloroflexota bacterium]
MTDTPASHAFVLPADDSFFQWYTTLRPYLNHFDRVAVIRGPAGNDLNPYRNVTAVNLPNMWLRDDALFHLRRIYPSVVLVDRLDISNTSQLATIINQRIQNNDRYGERARANGVLDERFTLAWATDYRPYDIVQPFTETSTGSASDVLGLEVRCQAGSKVLASATGRITKLWLGEQSDSLRLGKYVQVTTVHQGKQYVVTYAGLSNVNVPLNTTVVVGQKIAEVNSNKFLVIVQGDGGKSGYRLPSIIDPIPLVYIDGLRLRPTGSGLNVRKIPLPTGTILGQLQTFDFVIPRELHGRVINKTGREGEWINLKMPDGRTGFAGAWFLEATQFQKYALDVNPVGVNLDARHPLGRPAPNRLGDIGWVRFGYNVSDNRGSEDIVAAYNRYAPLAEAYTRAGYKVCFTTSHQTYGEAKGFPTWTQMQDENWHVLIDRFAEMMARISQQWAGKGLVHCWQIWNEQDAPIGAIASVPMSPQNYGRMIDRVLPAIKSADSDVSIITGGHTSGPGLGPNYARNAINRTPQGQRLDGVAFHPYGRDVRANSRYGQFGHIDDSVEAYSTVLPSKPLWITEWGVLDRPNDSPTDIANYATNMINHLKARYPGQIATLIWYAWAQGMHNGYGIVDGAERPRPPLTERFLQS